jgi:hypothetical protein
MNFSPCGVILELKALQLFAYPDRRFQYLNGLDSTIVEAPIRPLRQDGGMGARLLGVAMTTSRRVCSCGTRDAKIRYGLYKR